LTHVLPGAGRRDEGRRRHVKKQGKPETTKVNRRRLIRLINRYKAVLDSELAYLQSLGGETVDLVLPPAAPADDEGGCGGEGRKMVVMKVKDPGVLESNCVSNAGSVASDVELIDTLTPFVRALAE
jgi:hypothetical protein